MVKECSLPTLIDPVLGWLFDFVTKCWFPSVKYSRIGSGYQNQITVSSCYFKSLKDLPVFIKELAGLGMT
jgi:hypothetical protein